jgi:hypothetical protein
LIGKKGGIINAERTGRIPRTALNFCQNDIRSKTCYQSKKYAKCSNAAWRKLLADKNFPVKHFDGKGKYYVPIVGLPDG